MDAISPPDFNLLQRSIESLGESQQALLAAHCAAEQGDLHTACNHFARFAEVQTSVLVLSEAGNRTAPTPTALDPVAQTLINGLFMYADACDSLGKVADSESLRRRAVECAEQYLGSAGRAEPRCAARSLPH